ncbi:MAG TPA: hypothetical protein VN704_08465, partial [Verrucomicrobiae bacterium]|nr:hypothetical protein [Verrucomicrobiae bacterium]
FTSQPLFYNTNMNHEIRIIKKLFLYFNSSKLYMKLLIGILLVFLLLIASTNHKAIAQNISNMTGKGNYSGGGLSTKSVDIAKAHVTNLTSNMTGKGNYSGGGLSTKSVDIAKDKGKY